MIGEKIPFLTFSSLTGFLIKTAVLMIICICLSLTVCNAAVRLFVLAPDPKILFRSTLVPEDRNMRCFVCVWQSLTVEKNMVKM